MDRRELVRSFGILNGGVLGLLGVEHIHVHFGTHAAMVALLVCRLGGQPYSILFQAVERLLPEGYQFHIKLIGDGPLRDYAEQQIRDRGPQNHLEIIGWMPARGSFWPR